MDVLSETLNAVRMTGAIFFNAEFSAPWGFASPHARKSVPVLAPGAERLVMYHLVTEGEAWARIAGTGELPLAAGDVDDRPARRSAHAFQRLAILAARPCRAREAEVARPRAPCGMAAGASERASSAASSAASDRPSGCFLRACRRCSRSASAAMRPADGWKARSGIWSRGRLRAPRRRGAAVEDGGRALHRERCAAIWTSCRPSRPAGSRARATRSSAASLVPDPPQAVPSLDAGGTGRGGRCVALGDRRAIRAIPRRVAHGLSVALAAAARGETAGDDAKDRPAGGARSRLRVGGGVQSRLQARVRPAAGEVSPESRGTWRQIVSSGPAAGI